MYVSSQSRVTDRMIADNATAGVSDNLAMLYKLHQEIASGKKYQNPSDSPSGTSRALQLRSSLQANTAYTTTANYVDQWINSNESALAELTTVAERVDNLSFSAIGDTNGTVQRDAVKSEIQALIKQSVNIGNTSFNGSYIFNGYQVNSSTQPYILDDTTMTLTTSPADAGQEIVQKYGPGQSMTVNFNGETTVTPLINSMINIYNVLNTTPFDKNNMQTAIDTLTAAMDTLKQNRTDNGTRQKEITAQLDFMQQTDIELRSLISNNEDINVADASSQLQIQQTTYEKSIMVASKALSLPNLFDYLT